VRDGPDKFKHPRVDVYVRTATDGERQQAERDTFDHLVERVEVDGVAWPVVGVSWSLDGGRQVPEIMLRFNGTLRLHDAGTTPDPEPQP
jgi:hypothetical protein